DEQKRRGRQSPASMERLQWLSEENVLYSRDGKALTIEDRLELEQAIEQLSEQEKQIILLKYYEDMTITNISDVLACPPGTVKTRLHRALKKLRDTLGKGGRAHG